MPTETRDGWAWVVRIEPEMRDRPLDEVLAAFDHEYLLPYEEARTSLARWHRGDDMEPMYDASDPR